MERFPLSPMLRLLFATVHGSIPAATATTTKKEDPPDPLFFPLCMARGEQALIEPAIGQLAGLPHPPAPL